MYAKTQHHNLMTGLDGFETTRADCGVFNPSAEIADMANGKTIRALKAAAVAPRAHHSESNGDSQSVDLAACLCKAWIALLRALPERRDELARLYQQNPVRFNIRALDNLLDITRKGRLASALRCAGLRDSSGGPLPELGELRLENCASSEVWTIRGAVAAWHVATSRTLSDLPARALGERLLASRDQTLWMAMRAHEM